LSTTCRNNIWEFQGSVPLVQLDAFFGDEVDHDLIRQELEHFDVFLVDFFKVLKYLCGDWKNIDLISFKLAALLDLLLQAFRLQALHDVF